MISMKVRCPINFNAKSQVNRTTHDEDLGEGSTEFHPRPPFSRGRLYVWLGGLRLEGLVKISVLGKNYISYVSRIFNIQATVSMQIAHCSPGARGLTSHPPSVATTAPPRREGEDTDLLGSMSRDAIIATMDCQPHVLWTWWKLERKVCSSRSIELAA